MADESIHLKGHDEGPGGAAADREIEARLDALGRTLVRAEERRADRPPSAVLEAVQRRAQVRMVVMWGPRIAAAAAVVLAAGLGWVALHPAEPAPAPGPGPVAAAAETPVVESEAPTVANLSNLNRAASPETLQLPTGSGGAAAGGGGEPMRAADSRVPERVDAVLREK